MKLTLCREFGFYWFWDDSIQEDRFFFNPHPSDRKLNHGMWTPDAELPALGTFDTIQGVVKFLQDKGYTIS